MPWSLIGLGAWFLFGDIFLSGAFLRFARRHPTWFRPRNLGESRWAQVVLRVAWAVAGIAAIASGVALLDAVECGR